MLQRLDLLRDQCLLKCDVICSAGGGSTFSVECALPEIWDVTNVQAAGDVSRIIHWASRSAPGRKKRVKIDFFRWRSRNDARSATRQLTSEPDGEAVNEVKVAPFVSAYALLTGTATGEPGSVRICYASEKAILEEAMARLKLFLESRR